MGFWRPRYVGWLLAFFISSLVSPRSLRVVEGGELACDSVPMSGTFTVSNDLSCAGTTFEVAGGMDVIVSVSVDSTISKLRFFVNDGGSLTFSGGGNVTIADNYEPEGRGGAIDNFGSVSFAIAATFTGNSAKYGGAISNYNDASLYFESGATFTDNSVKLVGGAIYNHLGGAYILFASAANFAGNECTAGTGGAICNDSGGSITFASAVTFSNNTATDDGGAIYNGSKIGNIYGGGTISFASAAFFTGNTVRDGAGNAVLNDETGIVAFCVSPSGTDSGQENFSGTVTSPTLSVCATSSPTPIPTVKPTTVIPTTSPASVTVAPALTPSYTPTQSSTPSPVSSLTPAPSQILTPSPSAATGDALLVSETPAPRPTSSPTALDDATPVDISATPDVVSSSSSGINVGLIAGISAGGVILLIGIGLWCRPKYKSACLGTLFKQTEEAPSPPPSNTYDKKDVYSNQAPTETVNSIDEEANRGNHPDLEGIQLLPSSPKEETESATLPQEGHDVSAPQHNDPNRHQRPVMVEAGLMAFAAIGAVASHIPWVKDIYGLCDEIVQLLEANEHTSRNLTEIVSWIRQMQATLDSVANALGTCSPDDATSVNEALAGRAVSTLSHVKNTMEQYARRNMLAQFLLSRKLQADLQEAGKYFLEAIQALQLGLSAQQLQLTTQQLQVTTQQLQVTAEHFETTSKLLSISMKIDDDLSDIMSVVKNNEVMLAKVILQLAARSPSMRGEDMFDEGSEASTASLTPNNSHSRKSLVSELSVSSIPDLEHLNRDFIISLHNGKASKSVPIAAVVEALERLHIAPGDIIKLDSYPVGQGGFSKVYRVKVGEQVAAAKVVDLGALSAHHLQSVYKRFAKELYILSLLKSPYVVTIIGASATLDELALITEFMPRGSLRKVMDDLEEWSNFSISMALTVLCDVARGMLYLEGQGVRHKDLKSHNILVTADNHAKLIDFGLSKTSDAVTKSTETSAKSAGGGTVAWTAPELFDLSDDGTPHQGSFKSDVYSFGVVIWEVLAGAKQRPWVGIPAGTIINLILRGRKPPLPASALQYPELLKLMNDCMELDPCDRPTFADVCAQLIQLEGSVAHTG